MPSLFAKLKKALLLTAFGGLLFAVFVIDVIRGHGDIDLEFGWLSMLRNILVIVAFGSFYFLLESLWRKDQGPAKKFGLIFVLMLVVAATSGAFSLLPTSGFDTKGSSEIPLGFDSIVIANIFGIVLGATTVITLLILRDIIFWKRRPSTRRNFLFFLGFALASALSTLASKPLERSTLTTVLDVLAILAIALNSLRLSWIVYLSKREKLFSMVYGFFLFCIFIGLLVMTSSGTVMEKSLAYYSAPLKSFISSVGLFAAIYFGMTFLSTMFHLPTAEAYDRKISEVTSLHNLSRLSTQVFDFNELVETVTRMTLEVCQAQSSWLEIIRTDDARGSGLLKPRNDGGEKRIETVALNNISAEESHAITFPDNGNLRQIVLETQKPVVIDDAPHDKRTKHVKELKRKIGSMVIVPLLSHESIIGVLYATKEMPMGFDKDDVDLISAFADHAAIAIENSRLIEKSLERERLMREIMVAQEMQKKLLPQQLPVLSEVELEALSSPAFEVGGDYYDFTMLDDHLLGFIVGDVSGKGVSAAFYMAEMKGIFQSLSKIYPVPTEFLTKAHAALAGTIDRRSFISVIYGMLDLRDGKLTIARAGHCPMLYLAKEKTVYIQPVGVALGMGSSEFFKRTIVQESINLKEGDSVILFTDGLTEARTPEADGEEFGYERLLDVGANVRDRCAVEIRDAIIGAVDEHTHHQAPEDDLTLIVIKWVKK